MLSHKYSNLKIRDIDKMSGHNFEHFVAEMLNLSGYQNIKVTSGSGDNGVDILAELNGKTYAIQCKRYRKKISRDAVSDVVAGKIHYQCDVAMVITNSYLTTHALDFAKSVECLIIDRSGLEIILTKIFDNKCKKAFKGINNEIFNSRAYTLARLKSKKNPPD